MLERDMMHGMDWGGQDPAGWFITEKLDGRRLFWDGAALWTRSGRQIPNSFGLPAGIALDGEQWAGRGRHWRSPLARFVAFDCPSAPGDWPQRIAAARATGIPTVETCPCAGLDNLQEAFKTIKAIGGEGLMLRKPRDGGYRPGRTATLLKVKHGCAP